VSGLVQDREALARPAVALADVGDHLPWAIPRIEASSSTLMGAVTPDSASS
jgi:hypothetical protein